MSKIVLAEQASAPDTPASGKAAVYVNADGDLAWKDDGGTVNVVPALASANTFTAAQTVVAAGVGARRAASGAGAQIGYVGTVAVPYSLGNGASFTFTFDSNLDGLMFALSFGYGALLYAVYNSATIVELADPGNAIPAVFTVTKSANARTITITNVSGGAVNMSLLAFGAITAHT